MFSFQKEKGHIRKNCFGIIIKLLDRSIIRGKFGRKANHQKTFKIIMNLFLINKKWYIKERKKLLVFSINELLN